MPDRPPLDFAALNIGEMSRLLADSAISSGELVEFYLDRIARRDPKLHAFAHVFGETPRRATEAADVERLTGRASGPLHGVPIALKDGFHCSGFATRLGRAPIQARRRKTVLPRHVFRSRILRHP